MLSTQSIPFLFQVQILFGGLSLEILISTQDHSYFLKKRGCYSGISKVSLSDSENNYYEVDIWQVVPVVRYILTEG